MGEHSNARNNNNKNLPSSFTFQASSNSIDDEDLKSEECPKDNARNKIKNSEIEISNFPTNNSTKTSEIEEFKIIDNNEKEKINENNNYNNNILGLETFNSKEFDHPITVSNDIANINSKKINSIIQNHKNLKILKNKPNSGIKENEEENKGNNHDKENGQKFEHNLYSSEDGNIIDSDEESDSKSEIVKEIKERKARDSSMSKSLLYLSKEEIQKKLNNEKNNLKERIGNVKSDMLKLIGKDDYNYIMDLYSKIENNSGEIDEIYKKIEEYVKDKYPDDKRENFDSLYFSLISYECQLDKKEVQLKKYA